MVGREKEVMEEGKRRMRREKRERGGKGREEEEGEWEKEEGGREGERIAVILYF